MTLDNDAFTWSVNLTKEALENLDTFCKEMRRKYGQYLNPQEAKRAAYQIKCKAQENPQDF